MSKLEFASYNAAYLGMAQIFLAKRKAGDRTPRELPPTTITKNVAYQINKPLDAYLTKVVGATVVADGGGK